MALPGLTINVLDGNLNLQPGSNTRLMLYMGVCTLGTPATLYTIGDQTTLTNTLGLGKLVEAGLYGIDTAGGPAMFMPLNPSVAGSLGAVTHTGTGAMTLTVSAAPHLALTITCTTGGTLGTAVFTFKVGTVTSAPITSAASWSSTGYLVPGIYCTVTFVAGTYVAGATPDTYVISTLGVVTHPTGAGPAVPTFVASPIDDYAPTITVTTAGALGTSQFTYSLDGTVASTSSTIVTPGGGAYAIVNTGIVLTFSGAAVLGDTYTFGACGPSFASGDLATALTALETTYLASDNEAMITVLGGNATSSAWATQAATLETAATTLFNNGIYNRFITEVPTTGSIATVASAYTVNTTDNDTTVVASGASVTSPHVVGCAGDVNLVSPLTGLTQRRCCSFVVAARASSIEASRNVGDVSLGGVSGVAKLFRDENATPALDTARFTTMRTYPNYPGIYITDAHTFALSTSDYAPFTNARVIDRGCVIARANTLPYTNQKIPTKTSAQGLPGVITEKKARQIESKVNSAMTTGLVDSSPQDAVATGVTVNRTNNVLSSQNLQITVAVQPFGYARTVTVNIGLAVQA